MPLKDSLEAFYESKAPLSFTVTRRGEAKCYESHVGIINPMWCTECDITPNPLAVGLVCHCVAPRNHRGGSPLSSQGHRDSQTWGQGIVLFYHDAINRLFWFPGF